MRTRPALAALAAAGLVVPVLVGLQAPATAASNARFTLAQVKVHNKANNCWSAISGTVYNLTKWVNLHPGGAPLIKGLCGTDGTAAFAGQHATDARAKSFLAKYRVGVLVTKPQASSTASAAASSTATPSASTSPAATGALTAATVAQHNTAADCWSIVSGNVYNLTKWVTLHPGGAPVIKSMCGTDATAAYTGKHGNGATAARNLAFYKLGALGSTPTTAPNPSSTTSASPSASATTYYKAAAVASHKTAADCWVVINDYVYDVTDWITRHPGGQAVIKAACGKDASIVFARERDHQRADNQKMLATFRIGMFDASTGDLPDAVRTDD